MHINGVSADKSGYKIKFHSDDFICAGDTVYAECSDGLKHYFIVDEVSYEDPDSNKISCVASETGYFRFDREDVRDIYGLRVFAEHK